MVKSIVATPRIKRVGIGQKWFPAHLFNFLYYLKSVVGTQIRHIARFSKMDFYGSEFFVEIYLLYTRLLYELPKLLENVHTGNSVKICEKNF
jgi:hypothetical protein